MNSYIWIHIFMNSYMNSESIHLNSYTHEFIYSWIHIFISYMNSYNDYMNSYVYEFIDVNSYMNSYKLWIHMIFRCTWIHIIISYMNSHNDYMNLYVYEFIVNSYMNSYKLWFHICFHIWFHMLKKIIWIHMFHEFIYEFKVPDVAQQWWHFFFAWQIQKQARQQLQLQQLLLHPQGLRWLKQSC